MADHAATSEESKAAGANRTNWAGNYVYTAPQLAQPMSVEEAQALVREQTHSKALGAGHSFNSIADSAGAQISLGALTEMTLNPAGEDGARSVSVGAGIRYGALAAWLEPQGYALANLASLPHIGVAGACATGTHGSGMSNRCLSEAVSEVDFIDGCGELVHLSRDNDGDRFCGSVVALGALGLVTRLSLDVIPSFQVAQVVYEDLPFDRLEHDLDAVFSAAYSVSLFTDWQGSRATQAWLKHRMVGADATLPGAAPESFHGATLASAKLHPLPGVSAENTTEQGGAVGPWHERLPHFGMEYTPSSGEEIQSEYFVAREHGYQALRAVEKLGDLITPHLLISELRTVAADDLWMSMAHRRDSLALHFTWKPDSAAVLELLPQIEAALDPFDPRPHWGKVFTTPLARLRQLYPRFDNFLALVIGFDPAGKFRNDFTRVHLGLG